MARSLGESAPRTSAAQPFAANPAVNTVTHKTARIVLNIILFPSV